MINLVLECIDRLHVYSSAAHFADVAGKEAGESWKSILNSLYELLGMIHISALSICTHQYPLKPADCDSTEFCCTREMHCVHNHSLVHC